jgi:hypothetical protein
MIEGGPKIVRGIPDNEGQAVWDWLGWNNDHGLHPPLRVQVNRVESTLSEGREFGLKFTNVAIGPLDF